MSGPDPDRSANGFFQAVFHPTDFSPASELAFAHALAIAVACQSELCVLHAGGVPNEEWHHFPQVRRRLEDWGLLAPGSRREAVFDNLAVRVRKIHAQGNAVQASLDHIHRDAPDLVVLATEARGGLASWWEPSRASTIARRSGTMTLFTPPQARSLVDLKTGKSHLSRVLVPVDSVPSPIPAVRAAVGLAEALAPGPVEVRLLHIGDQPLPDVPVEASSRCTFTQETIAGATAELLTEAAGAADVMVMSTAGRDGVLDALRGSVTEQLLRQVDCPVLAVPVA